MLTMFLTGIANLDISYSVVRTLAYGFGIHTQTLSEIISNLFGIF